MSELRIVHLMTKDVHTAEPETPLAEVADRMRSQRISCIVVCEERTPVGVISERDLVRVLSDDLSSDATPSRVASDIMCSPVSSITEDSELALAIAEVGARKIRRLPVVDVRGELVGIVTQTDLLRAHVRELERGVANRTRALVEAVRRLELLSLQDELLGIGNRRAMEEALEQAHARARRHGWPYAVALFEADLFGPYSDCYGQLAAEELLRRVTGCLRETLRMTDSLYRYGKQGVLALLGETHATGARRFAERVREAVEAAEIPHCDSPLEKVTVSGGIASAQPGEGLPPTYGGLLKRAECALRGARAGGGNCIRIPDDEPTEASN